MLGGGGEVDGRSFDVRMSHHSAEGIDVASAFQHHGRKAVTELVRRELDATRRVHLFYQPLHTRVGKAHVTVQRREKWRKMGSGRDTGIFVGYKNTRPRPGCFSWSHSRGSNPRPRPYHGRALPTELLRRAKFLFQITSPKTCLEITLSLLGFFL